MDSRLERQKRTNIVREWQTVQMYLVELHSCQECWKAMNKDPRRSHILLVSHFNGTTIVLCNWLVIMTNAQNINNCLVFYLKYQLLDFDWRLMRQFVFGAICEGGKGGYTRGAAWKGRTRKNFMGLFGSFSQMANWKLKKLRESPKMISNVKIYSKLVHLYELEDGVGEAVEPGAAGHQHQEAHGIRGCS